MQTTHEIVNRCLWTAGMLLQSALLVALVTRQQARRFPAFTLLIAFYTLRAGLLYAVSGHIAAPDYGLLYDGLSLLDLLLQWIVAAEIALHVVRRTGGWTWRRSGVLLVLLGLAGCGGWLAAVMFRMYPHISSPRIHVDRGQVFISSLMLLLYGWTVWSAASGPVRRIVEGFAVYGLASLLSLAAATHAVMHRDSRTYMAAAYAPAVIYLGVVIFWLLTVKAQPQRSVGPPAAPPWRGAVEAANKANGPSHAFLLHVPHERRMFSIAQEQTTVTSRNFFAASHAR